MFTKWFRVSPRVAVTVLFALLASAFAVRIAAAEGVFDTGNLPNNFPFLNRAGTAATFSTALFGVGLLNSCGAKGGPGNLSAQPPVFGRFDLYDAWLNLPPGSCTTRSADRKRAQIARGQQLFNAENRGGRSCRGCHSAANNGSSASGALFDIRTSRPEFRKAGMPLYTLEHKVTHERRETTDPGRALRTGRWEDLDRFKTPSLRGLVARAPYFHNGIAATLEDVVIHYEVALDFEFTPQQRADLVAFMEAL